MQCLKQAPLFVRITNTLEIESTAAGSPNRKALRILDTSVMPAPSAPPLSLWQRAPRWLAAALALGILQWLGDTLVSLTHWPVHGSVVGMALLLMILIIIGGPGQGLQAVSSALLRHLMLFLIPSVAGVITYSALLAPKALSLLVAMLGGTVLTVLVCGWTVHQLLLRKQP